MNAARRSHPRRSMVLMGMAVLLGIISITSVLAVQDLTRSRLQVHRELSRIQARWLAQAGLEEWIAARVSGEPVTMQPAATQPQATQAQATEPQKPAPLDIRGATLTFTVRPAGEAIRVRCVARTDTGSTAVVQADVRLAPGAARIVRWEEH